VAAVGNRSGLVGSLLVAYWLLDSLVVGLPLVVLAARGDAAIVYAVGVAVLAPLNLFFCGWLDRHWDGWLARNGGRLEARLERMRSSRLMRHPVAWVQRGADAWLGLAAAITSAITAVSVARLVGGRALGRRRVAVAAVSYGVVCPAVWTLAGVLVGEAVRAA
jgi:hypothetical protein